MAIIVRRADMAKGLKHAHRHPVVSSAMDEVGVTRQYKQEQKIRANPAARITPLLKEVFGR